MSLICNKGPASDISCSDARPKPHTRYCHLEREMQNKPISHHILPDLAAKFITILELHIRMKSSHQTPVELAKVYA